MGNRKPKRFIAFHWHRRVGLLAVVLVIILAITGIMLNHTEQLGLDENYVQSSLVLDWYGLEPEGEPQAYAVHPHSISQWQQQIYFDHGLITTSQQKLRGAITLGPLLIAAFDSELLLISEQGELVERVSISLGKITRLGVSQQRAVIATDDAHYYKADENIIDWVAIGDEAIAWSEPASLSAATRNALLQSFRGNGLSMERLVLDLHSGRLFGRYGVYLMDAAAIALLWLSLSGLWVWWRRQEKQKSKHHYQKHHRSQ